MQGYPHRSIRRFPFPLPASSIRLRGFDETTNMRSDLWTDHAVFLAHLGSTLALVGLIWTVQVVQYPLFARVGAESFTDYHAGHSARISWIVLPLMLVELVTAIALVLAPPPGVSPASVWIGLGLVGVIWLSTFLLQVPRHSLLGEGFDADAHRFLVASNWLRTAAWTLRGALVLSWVARVSRGAS